MLITDSAYLKNGLSNWVWKWEENGFRNAEGLPVVTGNDFLYLHTLIKRFQPMNLEVNIWQVPRELNKDADRLANTALYEGISEF